MKYKLRPDAVLVTILDENMLVAVGSNMNCIDDMREVNETGAYYWKMLEKDMSVDVIIDQAMNDYGVSEEVARSSLLRFIESLCDAGYLTIEE